MSIMQKLTQKETWLEFYERKLAQGNLREKELEELYGFIQDEKYLEVLESGEFPPPKKSLIGKSGSAKKRTVYTFDKQRSFLLSLIAYLLYDYDGIFCANLYSFRKNTGVKKATEDILRIKDLDLCYVYKADISNYFGSVNTGRLIPMLRSVLCDDPELFGFISALLLSPFVISDGRVITENKGIMAGVPISGFLANLYLCDLDRHFYENGIPYMRYSDDILVFAKDRAELECHIKYIKATLESKGLDINPDKQTVYAPHDKISFLGFCYKDSVIDISEVAADKLISKMRRKTRALSRWAQRKKLPRTLAARAFIKRFNAKLYDNPVHSELTWTRWFFPVITTSQTLEKIDAYMQDCIRFLATGRRTKKRFDMRYADIKALGYRSLVNEYYRFKNGDTDCC